MGRSLPAAAAAMRCTAATLLCISVCERNALSPQKERERRRARPRPSLPPVVGNLSTSARSLSRCIATSRGVESARARALLYSAPPRSLYIDGRENIGCVYSTSKERERERTGPALCGVLVGRYHRDTLLG